MRYWEFPPDPILEPWVECFWTKRVRPNGEAPTTRVVPDGSIDIIVDALTGSGSLVGTMLRPKLIPHRDPLDLVAVRFRPGGARPFLGFEAAEITDLRLGLDDVGELRDLEPERLAETGRQEHAVRRLESFLLHRTRSAPPPDPLVRGAVEAIEARGGRDPIATVLERLDVGRRKLERLFARHVGIAPKQLARVVRLQNTLERLPHAPSQVDLALAGGYADQSHLIREFRALTGVTPGDWARRAREPTAAPPASADV